ncbi:hypothetical protein NDU88_006356 [Pleurodeles waltl]|uniref:Uncharacterized protein n=1 Tax=Pleurodeles waltl TaxID=8319 RepID=A0AAV7RLP7_PLEWA|nr:hypothetical protein NDU88_006356 [Pleurodeles waltl]
MEAAEHLRHQVQTSMERRDHAYQNGVTKQGTARPSLVVAEAHTQVPTSTTPLAPAAQSRVPVRKLLRVVSRASPQTGHPPDTVRRLKLRGLKSSRPPTICVAHLTFKPPEMGAEQEPRPAPDAPSAP